MKNEACAESDSSSDNSSDTESSGDERDNSLVSRQKRDIEWFQSHRLCLKCAEGHWRRKCPVPRETPPVRYNCRGSHPANSTTCSVYRENKLHECENRRTSEKCGVDTENYDNYKPPALQYPQQKPPRRIVVWPPPSTSSSGGRNHFGNVREGNPKLGGKMQLFSKTGYHLAVYPDGKVRGTLDENDIHTYLEVVSAGYPGHIKIRGLLTNLYIAINRKGRIYGEADPMEEATVFLESFRGLYNVYLSRKYAHLGWYIAIKKNGKPKRASKTSIRQKAVQFLPRRSKFE